MKISTAYIRDLERQVAKGKITYSRMVELLNERANEPNTSDRQTKHFLTIKKLI